MKIGIILGSIREGRNGERIANWVLEQAQQRGDAEYVLIDLKEFDVPLLTAPVPPMMMEKQYGDPGVTRWSQAIDACDAFILVTPEYNHGVPGALKNAVDTLGPEWQGKVVGFVGYGADGALRAIENWRVVLANFSMHDVRAHVGIHIFSELTPEGLALSERRPAELAAVLDQVVALGERLGG